jgi:WD40 repeat protein
MLLSTLLLLTLVSTIPLPTYSTSPNVKPCNTYTTPSTCAKANNIKTGGCTWVKNVKNPSQNGGKCMKACGYIRKNAQSKCVCNPNGITHTVGRPSKEWWGSVFDVDFSSSDKVFALGYPANGIHIFSTQGYDRVNIIDLQETMTIKFSNKMDSLLASSYATYDNEGHVLRQVAMINITSGYVYPPVPGGGTTGFYNGISFSSDGKLMSICLSQATDNYAGYVRILSTTDFIHWTFVRDIELKGSCTKAKFSPTESTTIAAFDSCQAGIPLSCKNQDPDHVVGGFDSDSVILWQPVLGKQIRKLTLTGGDVVLDFAFASGGDTMAILAGAVLPDEKPRKIVYFNVHTGAKLFELTSPFQNRHIYEPIFITPSHNLVINELFDWNQKSCELWGLSLNNGTNGEPLNRYLYRFNQVSLGTGSKAIAMSNSGKDFLIGNDQGYGILFDDFVG